MTQQTPTKSLYLASGSPRRQELMAQLNLDFKVLAAPIDESVLANESALAYVARMAQVKAIAGFEPLGDTNAWVVGGDTSVIYNAQILGKPKTAEHAIEMLSLLSGSEHEVLSAIAIKSAHGLVSRVNKTIVRFKGLSTQEIEAYVATKEPEGKAGAYAVQGLGAAFIENLNGSYSGVMGLPLFELNQLLVESNYKTE